MKTTFRGLCAAYVAAALAGGVLSPLLAAGEGWLTDWEAAKKTAAEQKKNLLVDFTGSDWCGWCIKLDKEVFSEALFKDEASKKYVFVALDFPRKKELPEAEKKQNEQLQNDFAVEGFPTIFLADAEGRPFAKTGYQPGGPKAYLEHLEKISGSKDTRDQAFAAAASAEGLGKAQALKAALESLPDDLGTLAPYAGVLDEIKKLDKDDTLGLAKAAAIRSGIQELETELYGLAREQKRADIPAKVDAFLEKNPLEGEQKQKVLFMKLLSCGPEDYDRVDAYMDAVIAADGETSFARQAVSIKERVKAIREQAAKTPPQPEEKK